MDVLNAVEDYASSHFAPDFTENLDWPSLDDAAMSDGSADMNSSAQPIDVSNKEAKTAFTSLEVQSSRIKIEHALGKGQFGAVSSGKLSDVTGRHAVNVAIKSMLKSGTPPMALRQFEYEARLLASLTHAHIVSVLGVCFKESPQMLVLELMAGGDLRSYLREHSDDIDDNGQLVSVCVQIADAMAYLQQRRVVHRDLAAR